MRRAVLFLFVLLAAAPALAQEDTDADDADDECVCTVGEPVPACKEVCDPTPGGGRASCSFVP